MKEDYLWDKTGTDAEIERLENALKAFRCAETVPPAIAPPREWAEQKKGPRRFFQWKLAIPAFAAVLAALLIGGLQIAPRPDIAAESFAETVPSKRAEKTAGDSFVEPPGPVPVRFVRTPPPEAAPQFVKTRLKAAPVVRRRQTPPRTNRLDEPDAALTAEERYAYDQLMLALAITGSKLRIVKDKIDGVEEKTAVLETVK